MKPINLASLASKALRFALGVMAGGILWVTVNPATAQTPPPDLPPGVQDIVKLTRAGMTEDLILTQVKNAGATYNLSADQIIFLSGQGVTQNVIKALLHTGGAAAAAPITVPSTPPPVVTPVNPAPSLAPPTAPPGTATPGVGFDYFHDQLAPYGSWMQDPALGWCWRPTVASADPYWRPYLDQGRWTYTDSGWYWQSDYPWGEIPFHYGRWQRSALGWVWVPGYDWAPAWVTWRHAEGFCGWAPLPPAAVFRAGIGFEFGGRVGLDLDFGLGPDMFTFIPYDHFWDLNLHAFALPRDRVDFVFRHSNLFNGYRFDHGRFIVEGVGRERIAALTHREVRPVAVVIHDSRVLRHVEENRRGGRDDRHDPFGR